MFSWFLIEKSYVIKRLLDLCEELCVLSLWCNTKLLASHLITLCWNLCIFKCTKTVDVVCILRTKMETELYTMLHSEMNHR